MTDDEAERRRRAAEEQTRSMFDYMDKSYDEHTESTVEDINNGTSYNTAADSMNTTRQTLSRINQDPDRRAWYVAGEASDNRVAEALEDIQ